MIEDLRTTFRRLHADGCFVLPNPWDVGSAVTRGTSRYLDRVLPRDLRTAAFD